MKRILIKLPGGVGGFAEDKDEAKRIRVQTILPAFASKTEIILDFSEVKYSTQSFIHALLGEVLKRYGADSLDHIEFRHCASQVKSLVQLVVDYSLGGFSAQNGNSPHPTGTAVKRTLPKQRAKA